MVRNPKVSLNEMRRALRTSDPASTEAVDVTTSLDAIDADLTAIEEDDALHLPSQEIVLANHGSVVVADGLGAVAWAQPSTFIPLAMPVAALSWALMPAAETEFLGLTIYRVKAALTYYSEARVVVNVSTVGVAGAKMKVQYSLDAAAWSDLTQTAAVDALGVAVSAWAAFAEAARADVFLRPVGLDGDGIVSPAFGSMILEVR